MALIKYKLGSLIEQSDARNDDGNYTVDYVRGISTDKEFIETKANMDGVSLTSYKIVYKNEFAYVADTSRRGDKIALAFNSDTEILISSIYTVFRVTHPDLLNSEYLFMFFNRPEFDRYARFNSWGSARETFSWEDMCDIDIELPPLQVQQKFVEIYKAMIANQRSYEYGLDKLVLTFEALVEEQKHKANKKLTQELLEEVDYRNVEGIFTEVKGINITKQFMPSVANTYNVNLKNYKLVHNGQFAFSGMQTGRDHCIRIALYTGNDPIIISPAYTVFQMKDKSVLPEYIMIWFSRREIDRLGWFMSDSSIRTNLDMDRFYEIEIPIPDLSVQKSIIEIYEAYKSRRSIAEFLKSQIKDICPILIKGSIDEARVEA